MNFERLSAGGLLELIAIISHKWAVTTASFEHIIVIVIVIMLKGIGRLSVASNSVGVRIGVNC